MSATTPTTEPTAIVAGDTVEWTKSLSDYSAADSWVLSYILLSNAVSPVSVSISSTASGADHAVSVSAATSAAYTAGTYHWTSFVTKGTERKTISSGVLVILPNPAAVTHTDPRTHAEKCLAAIEAVIEGRMADPIVEYQIGNRMAKKIPHGELLKLRAIYKAEVRRERGGPTMTTIPVRFGHV